MQIILLDTMQNLGEFGDQVKVKSGYARNFLIPKGYAVQATEQNRAAIQTQKAERDSQQIDKVARAQVRIKALHGLTVTITRKAGVSGRLYGSIGAVDIVEALAEGGHEITRSEVRLSRQTIREVGEYPVTLSFHQQTEATITVRVIADS